MTLMTSCDRLPTGGSKVLNDEVLENLVDINMSKRHCKVKNTRESYPLKIMSSPPRELVVKIEMTLPVWTTLRLNCSSDIIWNSRKKRKLATSNGKMVKKRSPRQCPPAFKFNIKSALFRRRVSFLKKNVFFKWKIAPKILPPTHTCFLCLYKRVFLIQKFESTSTLKTTK